MEKNDVNYIKRDKCVFCKGEEFICETKIYDYDSHLGEFSLLKCANCGMYYTSPYPDENTLPLLYGSRKSKNFDAKSNFMIEKIKDYLAKIQIKKILKKINIKKPKIVDFGTGNARFACSCFDAIEGKDKEVLAVDFPEEKPIRLKEARYENIKYINTKTFYESAEQADLIFLRHVLEHTENPKSFLLNLMSHLSSEGLLVIEVPNIKNGISKFFNKYSPSYYPPYHLVHFTSDNLHTLLSSIDINFEIVQDEMPVMSNLIANVCNQPLSFKYQLIGIILHPIQLLLSIIAKNKTVLVAYCKKK